MCLLAALRPPPPDMQTGEVSMGCLKRSVRAVQAQCNYLGVLETHTL